MTDSDQCAGLEFSRDLSDLCHFNIKGGASDILVKHERLASQGSVARSGFTSLTCSTQQLAINMLKLKPLKIMVQDEAFSVIS